MSSAHWLAFANNDPAYANWLERVDDLCDRLLDVRFADLIEVGDFDPLDTYRHGGGVRPDRYVVDYIIPYLQNDHGADMVFEIIGESVLWGKTVPLED